MNMDSNFKKRFMTYYVQRFKDHVNENKKMKVDINMVTTIRQNKKDLKAYQMAKSAWYFEEVFTEKLPTVTNKSKIVLAGIEFAILNLLAIISPRSSVPVKYEEKDSKLLIVYFDFFLAQSSFIYFVNERRESLRDNNIDQKFPAYLNLLDEIRSKSSENIKKIKLAYFNGTFNDTMNELKTRVKEIVHGQSYGDDKLRFELVHDAACHVHKHNIRDVYDDEFRKDKLFIPAEEYLSQANFTIANDQSKDFGNQDKKLKLYNHQDDDDYTDHIRKSYIDERKDGRNTISYLSSYYKTTRDKLNDKHS